MKTILPSTWAAGALMLAVAPAQDIPDQPATFGGTYQVVSSNDPSFPMKQNTEYFMDFGQKGPATQGRVAVSTRENPSVRVRVFSWQFSPSSQSLMMGNGVVGETKQAVARVIWNLRRTERGYVLQRNSYRLVLHPVNPETY